MTIRLSHVAPVRCGTVLAVLYGLLSLIFIPFFIGVSLIAPHAPNAQGTNSPFPGGFLFLAILFPIMYAFFGFIGGIIAAAIYNLVAGWTGGFELTFTDANPGGTVPPGLPPNLI